VENKLCIINNNYYYIFGDTRIASQIWVRNLFLLEISGVFGGNNLHTGVFFYRVGTYIIITLRQ
jgi:hypothetical protein